MTSTTQKSAKPGQRVASFLERRHEQMNKWPGLDYLMLRIIIFLLVGIGVTMVFSSSMAESLVESGLVWGQALRQSAMVLVGLLAFWVALKIPPRAMRWAIPWILLLSIVLLILVLIPGVGTGRAEVGSQSWIILGPISLQPSELARVAIGLFGASALANKQHRPKDLLDPFMVYSAIAGLMFLLIILQGDLGMAMSFAVVVVFTLFFAGVDWRVVASIIGLAVAGVIFVFLSGGFRSHRFHTYFDALVGNIQDTQGTGFQAYQGFLSLADGGVAGVGIGQSRAKWFYLPEAKNDFIFAVVGEELGLWGGALVIVLFALLGFFGIRTALRAQNQFHALMAATLTTGVVAQAYFNIGYVVGLLPVTGIQLPMISAGGTAAIITIGSMGLLCNVARHEPEAVSAMRNYGRPLFDRLFFVPEPEPADAAPRGGRRRADGSGAPWDRRPERPGASPQRRGSARRQQQREERFGSPVTGRTRPVRSTPRGQDSTGRGGDRNPRRRW